MVSICNVKLDSGMGAPYLCSILNKKQYLPNLCNIPKMIHNLYQVYMNLRQKLVLY